MAQLAEALYLALYLWRTQGYPDKLSKARYEP